MTERLSINVSKACSSEGPEHDDRGSGAASAWSFPFKGSGDTNVHRHCEASVCSAPMLAFIVERLCAASASVFARCKRIQLIATHDSISTGPTGEVV